MTPNTEKETAVFQKYGLILEDREQLLADAIHIYPTEYFNPIHWGEKEPHLTVRTVSIHWSIHSWGDNANICRVCGYGKSTKPLCFSSSAQSNHMYKLWAMKYTRE